MAEACMVEIVLLGVAQDAGVPQAGCGCATCLAAHQEPALRQYAVALGIIDHATQQRWMIDATPDIRFQLHPLGSPFSGIFLSHAHLGHYTGLLHLGYEGWHSRDIPVYASAQMATFLEENAPFSALLSRRNIQLLPFSNGVPISLSSTLTITPIRVPHRAEYTDTYAFLIRGPHHTLFYCTDIDYLQSDTFDIRPHLATADIVLLDATFYSPADLPGRNLADIPHAYVVDTLAYLSPPPPEAILIHLNHSNPLWHPGTERTLVEQSGWQIGKFLQRWTL
jgi:pyrroloquinoline quinone biosynthesis protein B